MQSTRLRWSFLMAATALMLLVSSQAGARQAAVLVKDINPGPAPISSHPRALAAIGDTLFFEASDGVTGRELWKSDGTRRGTTIVKDINPGSGSSFPIQDITAVGSTAFFTVDDGVTGRELWKSDGTMTGTTLVKDINPESGSDPGDLTAVGSTLFFHANDGTTGSELWKTESPYDVNHTIRVKDIAFGSFDSSPGELTAVGTTLFFRANDRVAGVELWKSDGTESGTELVKDINVVPTFGPGNSSPGELTAMGTTLFFTADDEVNGRELWKSDGTDEGTILVKDIRGPGPISSGLRTLTAVGATLFFAADDGVNGLEPWKSNGTNMGTTLVKDIKPGPDSSFSDPLGHPPALAAVGSVLFFAADDGVSGRELWRSDGTEVGTILIKDIKPGIGGALNDELLRPPALTAVATSLLFAADDGVSGRELWRSDGTSKGTVRVKDIFPGPSSSLNEPCCTPLERAALGNALFFAADDGRHGTELWRAFSV